jgi:hypothetical protein
MKKINKYHTGYITIDWVDFPPAPYKGKGWTISFLKTKNCQSFARGSYNGKKINAREVIIYSPSFEKAQQALSLLNCAIWLVNGEPTLAGDNNIAIPFDKRECSKVFLQDVTINKPSSCCMLDFPLSCLIATKASFFRKYKNALAKFRIASQMHSISLVDMDPSHSRKHLGVSGYAYDHVRFAFSIIAAYSVLEELGLEIRASIKKPSIINNNWNPLVKKDLENRLRKAGIILQKKIAWVRRGKPTKIEKAKQPLSQKKCSWARGPYVRDCEIEVIDAINIASFLRSKISSHKLGDLVLSLTSYDVENVRHLAGRLLFACLRGGEKKSTA